MAANFFIQFSSSASQHSNVFLLPLRERVAVGKRLHTAVLDEEAHLLEERGRQAGWLLAQQAILGLGRHAAGKRELTVVVRAALRIHAIGETIWVK